MSDDSVVQAILAKNFSEQCGDPTSDAKKAAQSAIEALEHGGFIIAKDPEG